MAKTEKKEEKIRYLLTKDVAAIHKMKPSKLRRVLRSLKQFQDGGYTRYKWEEGDPFLATLGGLIEKFNVKERERNQARLASLKAKGKEKKGAKAEKPKTAKEKEAEAEEIV